MFELYSAWTWLPVVHRGEHRGARSGDRRDGEHVASAVAFAALAMGGVGCVWGGLVADRRGREWLVTWRWRQRRLRAR